MADCKDINDQRPAYEGTATLTDARVVRAEIDSINSVNNTAEVTLLDVCEDISWLDPSAVPFDYLCEGNEQRTAEALAYGYKAFAPGDMVYLLIVPELGDTEAQAYIVGHIDIKDTRVCGSEYLLVYVAPTINGSSTTVYTIINLATGSVLDLSSFEPKEGSPAPPPSIPFSGYDSWVDYNFSVAVTPRYTVPFTITTKGQSTSLYYYNAYISGLVPLVNEVDTPYTGQGYATTCAGLDLGNGYEEFTSEYDGEYDEAGANIREAFSLISSGADKATDGAYCKSFFTSSIYTEERVYTHPEDDMWLKIYDSYYGTTQTLEVSREDIIHKRLEQSTSDGTTTISCSYSYSINVTLDYSSFGSLFTHNIGYSVSYSAALTTAGPDEVWEDSELPANSWTCSDADNIIQRPTWTYTSPVEPNALFRWFGDLGQVAIGTDHICAVFGMFHYIEQDDCSSVPNPAYLAASAGYMGSGSWGRSGPSVSFGSYPSPRYDARFTIAAVVAKLEDCPPIGVDNRVSLADAVKYAHAGKSAAISRAVEGLGEYINTLITDRTSYAEVNAVFQTFQNTGPVVYIVNKAE